MGATEGGLGKIAIAFSLFVIFSFLIISIAVDFGSEYGKSSNEIGGGSLNITAFQTPANQLEENTSALREGFEKGDPSLDVDSPTGFFDTITSMVGIFTTPFTLIGQIAENIFGVPSIFINVILAVLSVIIIFMAWRALRAGY